jgi:poly(U)-specific endoribonuclease
MAANTIFQQMWDADQNGFHVYLQSERPESKDFLNGVAYVKIMDDTPNPHLMELVNYQVNGGDFGPTYEAVRKLFDNYSLNRGGEQGPVILKEISDFLDLIIPTNVLKMAKAYIEQNFRNVDISTDAKWKDHLKSIFFHGAPVISKQSLFEHVFVGDGKSRKLGGHHFWYKFFLEDHGLLKVHGTPISRDQIVVSEFITANREVVTVEYSLDQDGNASTNPLFKKVGGFFVGVSPECLVAFGIVAYHVSGRHSRTFRIRIDGDTINIQLYAPGQDGNPFRTFYPVIN